MMLEHLGEDVAAARVHEALASVCGAGREPATWAEADRP